MEGPSPIRSRQGRDPDEEETHRVKPSAADHHWPGGRCSARTSEGPQRVLRIGVNRACTEEWTAQQPTEVTPFGKRIAGVEPRWRYQG